MNKEQEERVEQMFDLRRIYPTKNEKRLKWYKVVLIVNCIGALLLAVVVAGHQIAQI